jgi:hypothetical protein
MKQRQWIAFPCRLPRLGVKYMHRDIRKSYTGLPRLFESTGECMSPVLVRIDAMPTSCSTGQCQTLACLGRQKGPRLRLRPPFGPNAAVGLSWPLAPSDPKATGGGGNYRHLGSRLPPDTRHQTPDTSIHSGSSAAPGRPRSIGCSALSRPSQQMQRGRQRPQSPLHESSIDSHVARPRNVRIASVLSTPSWYSRHFAHCL